jgi:hypothetical protein
MLKKSHSLYVSLHLQKGNEIKQTYISDYENSASKKTPSETLRSPSPTPPNNPKETKQPKYKKGQEMGFKDIYE